MKIPIVKLQSGFSFDNISCNFASNTNKQESQNHKQEANGIKMENKAV